MTAPRHVTIVTVTACPLAAVAAFHTPTAAPAAHHGPAVKGGKHQEGSDAKD
ncbi:MAG: hypothetical protein QNL11_10465 [Desulfobacterales bacterium]|nr:hypothetical protein [Desulfobacterales bacterium]